MAFWRSAIAAVAILLATPAWAGQTWIQVGSRQNIRASLIAPDGPGPYPGILVLSTSRGVAGADTEFAARLVQQGYVCLVPFYLETYGVTGKDRFAGFTSYADTIYGDLASAVDTLARVPQVRGSKIGAVGFSNGGFFTTWLAATHKVAAGVSYYGAITGAGTDNDFGRFRGYFNSASSPLLLMVGDEDHYRGPTHRLAEVLRAASRPHQAIFYPGAHHEFDRVTLGDGDRQAATDAWQRTTDLFARYLKAD